MNQSILSLCISQTSHYCYMHIYISKTIVNENWMLTFKRETEQYRNRPLCEIIEKVTLLFYSYRFIDLKNGATARVRERRGELSLPSVGSLSSGNNSYGREPEPGLPDGWSEPRHSLYLFLCKSAFQVTKLFLTE